MPLSLSGPCDFSRHGDLDSFDMMGVWGKAAAGDEMNFGELLLIMMYRSSFHCWNAKIVVI